jgi:seryl-tRNA synthetase
MLDPREVADNLEAVRDRLRRRSEATASLLDPIAELADKRRKIITAAQAGQAERNAASKAMSKADKQSPEFATRRDELKELSTRVKELEVELAETEAALEGALALVPNLPDDSVPVGKSEEDNVVVKTWGKVPEMSFTPRHHDEIGPALGLMDFERAAKISGSRFVVLRGALAKLERALINFMLDLHTREHGYTEVLPPLLIKDTALYGTGQLPKFEADLFKTHKADPDKSYALYLSPTSEVQLTNLRSDEILEDAELPIAMTAFTACFRSEAGSYGQDVRGMIRQHQFNKVELVRICRPEEGLAQLELLTSHAEQVLERLGLHYRRVLLCTADMGFGSCKTYDLEVWLPGQQRFREISSCSSCSDFQARRAKIRYRPEKGAKPRLCHTLNGSGLAVGRTLIAIVEQYQQADGSVVVPEALRAFMGCERIEAAG